MLVIMRHKTKYMAYVNKYLCCNKLSAFGRNWKLIYRLHLYVNHCAWALVQWHNFLMYYVMKLIIGFTEYLLIFNGHRCTNICKRNLHNTFKWFNVFIYTVTLETENHCFSTMRLPSIVTAFYSLITKERFQSNIMYNFVINTLYH